MQTFDKVITRKQLATRKQWLNWHKLSYRISANQSGLISGFKKVIQTSTSLNEGWGKWTNLMMVYKQHGCKCNTGRCLWVLMKTASYSLTRLLLWSSTKKCWLKWLHITLLFNSNLSMVDNTTNIYLWLTITEGS